MDGFALLFWFGLAAIVLLVAAGSLERIFTRPNRRWIRRLRELEAAKVDWAARIVASQCFYKQEK